MGGSGGLSRGLASRLLVWRLLKESMDPTAKLSTFVVFILVGARVFSLTFYGVSGNVWVEHLLTSLPGGQLGFLIVGNARIICLSIVHNYLDLSMIEIKRIGDAAEDVVKVSIVLSSLHDVSNDRLFM